MINKMISAEHRLILLIVVIAVLKLIFIGNTNILALNAPHDDYWYVHTAFNNIWGGEYNNMSFIHLQLYSVWLKVISVLGVPARLAIEAGWLIACGYLSLAVYRMRVSGWLIILLFSYLVFHPYSIGFFGRSLAETLLAVMSALVAAAGIELWNSRNENWRLRYRVAFLIYVLGFAVAYHVRKEGVVLLAPIALLGIVSLLDKKIWWSGVARKKIAISLIIAPVVATVLFGTILAGANYAKWGVWARYELAAPGYKRVLGALNSIDTGRTPYHVTVTHEMLDRAYQESPTFRELKPFMEGQAGRMWYTISNRHTGISAGIGNGWFYWALRDVAAAAGWHSDAQTADKKYLTTANELEVAFTTGRLKKRGFTVSSFIDPDIGKWVPELPASIVDVAKLVVKPIPQYLDLPMENASAEQLEQYVAITGKRELPAITGVIMGVNGWVILPAGAKVGLGTDKTTFVWVTLNPPQRPDVNGAYAFSLKYEGAEIPTELHILSQDGIKGSVELKKLKAQTTSNFSGVLRADIGIDSFDYSKISRANLISPKLFFVYQWVGYLFCIVAVISLFLSMIKREFSTDLFILFLLTMTAIMSRVAVFGIIDASSWNSVQARYMLPVVPFFACMGVLAIALLTSKFNKENLS